MGHPVKIDTSEVATALEIGSRQPFVDELARFLDARPSEQTLTKFAARHPDRWASMVATFARLSGYNDRTESVNLNLFANIKNMSDAELEEELASLQEKLAALKSPHGEAVS